MILDRETVGKIKECLECREVDNDLVCCECVLKDVKIPQDIHYVETLEQAWEEVDELKKQLSATTAALNLRR